MDYGPEQYWVSNPCLPMHGLNSSTSSVDVRESEHRVSKNRPGPSKHNSQVPSQCVLLGHTVGGRPNLGSSFGCCGSSYGWLG
jgi:hypothetical protein